jgi:guanine deaminase
MFLNMCAMQAGLRAYVGKVCMDRNSKEYYVHSPEQNLADTEAFLNHVRYQTLLAHRLLHSRTSPAVAIL